MRAHRVGVGLQHGEAELDEARVVQLLDVVEAEAPVPEPRVRVRVRLRLRVRLGFPLPLTQV